jgi:iron complex transport system ATP-binding protein
VGITHLLLLRGGKVVAAGPLRETLTNENLSRTFGMKLQVEESDNRWSARSVRSTRRARD